MKVVKCSVYLLFFLIILTSTNQLCADNDFNEFAKCIYKKDINAVKELLSKGADVNTRNKTIGITPLFVACSMNGTYDIVELLINKGADINIKDSRNERTPLMMAAQNSKETTELLLKNGAKVDLKSTAGETAFTFSIYGILSSSVNITVCDILLEKGADINNQLKNEKTAGWTALMTATTNGKIELVKYLISNGAKVNLKAKDGSSALSLAIKKDNNEIVKLLKANGAKE